MPPPKDPEKYKIWLDRMKSNLRGRTTGRRGKAFTEIFGTEKAEIISKKISSSRRGKTYEAIYGSERGNTILS